MTGAVRHAALGVMKKIQAPVVIEFIPGSRVMNEEQKQPHHTWISFSHGEPITVPTDQIIHCEDAHGAARVGLGGMSFEGLENEKLVFWRVRDLYPEETLHPERAIKVSLDTSRVATVHMQGTQVWPRTKVSKHQAY
ncbi:MAG TPA: hypothetical protein DCS07_13110 [Bdellovibrionales bacterium]|nr:MAG: hypothetical protein A2Z97_01275 [Bdellovibrionales bacterium GWB1_52_6]HAR43546.1 hypothetical protein [Bdellovibrionales bacterium]